MNCSLNQMAEDQNLSAASLASLRVAERDTAARLRDTVDRLEQMHLKEVGSIVFYWSLALSCRPVTTSDARFGQLSWRRCWASCRAGSASWRGRWRPTPTPAWCRGPGRRTPGWGRTPSRAGTAGWADSSPVATTVAAAEQ